MTATKIIIIRHAEKPDGTPGSPVGVTVDGVDDKDSLTVQGWQRAGALAEFFSPANTGLAALGLAVPDVILASDDHKHPSGAASPPAGSSPEEGSHSKRPIETVTPLAAKLGKSIDSSDYWLGDEQALVKGAIASAGVVLICWQHEHIPTIANLLIPPPNPIPSHWPVPQKWPGSRYDVVWVFAATGESQESWSFSQVPQNLLAGDINAPIDPKHDE